jgi:hypothetical protein
MEARRGDQIALEAPAAEAEQADESREPPLRVGRIIAGSGIGAPNVGADRAAGARVIGVVGEAVRRLFLFASRPESGTSSFRVL